MSIKKNPPAPPPSADDAAFDEEPDAAFGAAAAPPAPPPAAPKKKREINASFPMPAEWEPGYQPGFVRPSALRIPDDIIVPINVPMEYYHSSKDDKNFDGAIAQGMRPVERPPNAHHWPGRPIIDQTSVGSVVEKHDLILMQAPKALMDKTRKLAEKELISQAHGLQTSYEESTIKSGARPVNTLFARGMPHEAPQGPRTAAGEPAELEDPTPRRR